MPSIVDEHAPILPEFILLEDLPHLCEAATWHIQNKIDAFTPEEIFCLYERNWRYIDPDKIVGGEARTLDLLIKTIGKGVFLV